jgi:hypothetical protein
LGKGFWNSLRLCPQEGQREFLAYPSREAKGMVDADALLLRHLCLLIFKTFFFKEAAFENSPAGFEGAV